MTSTDGLQKMGIACVVISLMTLVALPFLSTYSVDVEQVLAEFDNPDHHAEIRTAVADLQEYGSPFSFIRAYQQAMDAAQMRIQSAVEADGLTPSDDGYWAALLQDWQVKESLFPVVRAASGQFPLTRPVLFFLVFGLCVIGALMYILPKFRGLAGIRNNGIYHSKMHNRGWVGIATGVFLIGFYILIYFYPHYIFNWVWLVDPVSVAISGNPASHWFFYGFVYTLVILVMGVRMFAKYRHNMYQMIRTTSVMFFQLAFAFLIPEILVSLNQPYYDFKNIWPLDYDFFFEWHLSGLIESGGLGLFMLVWGIALILIAVPVITYFYGKRWYCSWVCGCGGLAETLGDPYRQLSDKSLGAWKFERWLVHGVLVFAVAMTGMVLYTYFSGSSSVLFLDSFSVRSWYGFAIGSIFAGVVGTGFYPLFGNRVWCRFGCPLAAYLGIVQRFKSRFRITTNGGQCISCGNCSTYCEMGIDVRAYAQRGQDIVRASCVGCGICAAVCPRGVLRLENSGLDVNERAAATRAILITEDQVRMLN